MNLIGNAIKFTPERGEIPVIGHSLGGGVRLEVRDSGPGIPIEDNNTSLRPSTALERLARK